MTYEEKFDLYGSEEGPWEIHFSGTDQIAGHLRREDNEYHLMDSQDNDLGAFESTEKALTSLYGSD